MNKKILTSLLLSPLAVGSWAITYVPDLIDGGKGWTQSGISGTTNVFENGVNCPIEGGQLERKVSLLPGNYKLVFTGAKDVTVVVNGESYAIADENGSCVFEVGGDKATEVTLTVMSTTGTGFKFTTLAVDLEFDFIAAAQALTEALGKIKVDDIDDPDSKIDTSAVETLRSTIEGQIAALTGADQTKAYEENMMWDYPEEDKITTDINNLKAQVEALNAAIAADNKAYADKQANDAAYADLTAMVTELENALNAADTKFDEAVVAKGIRAADIRSTLTHGYYIVVSNGKAYKFAVK